LNTARPFTHRVAVHTEAAFYSFQYLKILCQKPTAQSRYENDFTMYTVLTRKGEI